MDGLEHKAVSMSTAPASGVIATGDEGVVEALVAVTGVVDNVGDVILPGAFTKALAERRPKGINSHDTKVWTARSEEIQEWLPGDPRLPSHTKDGKPWPREAGAVYVRCRYNLATPHGRAAFEDVKFFSETNECEWSIGYQVPKGGARKDPRTGIRYIKALHWFEYSQVLFGAASQSMTLSVKTGLPAGQAEEGDAANDPGWDDLLAPIEVKAADAGVSPWDALLGGIGGKGDGTADGDTGPGAMISFTIPVDVAQQLAVPGGEAPEQLHITLAYLGKGLDEGSLNDAAVVAEQVAAEHGPLSGTVGGIGAFPAGEDGVPVYVPVDVPGLEILRQRLIDALDDAGVPYATNHGYTPHVTLAYAAPEDPLPDPVEPVDVEFGTVTLAVDGDHQDFPLAGTPPVSAVDEVKHARLDMPLGQAVEEAAYLVKHAMGEWETKAGRVLSDQNGKRLRAAVLNLLAVLKTAGIDVGEVDRPEWPKQAPDQLPPDPVVMPDSTAPSALPNELKQITPEEFAAGLDILAAAALG